FFSFIVNSPDTNAWPFCALQAFVISPDNLSSRCEDQAQFFRFHGWILTNEKARDATRAAGFAPLALGLRTQAQDYAASIVCDNEPVVRD
ncbi:hypothetical protein ACKI2C_49440, partial [Streptomyces brasiliscabiei]|uniref:hypothetical protein n=1 Tax=Streptomyces brasiliscabiei TaxID=2736302 RepID=UPI0038F7955A